MRAGLSTRARLIHPDSLPYDRRYTIAIVKCDWSVKPVDPDDLPSRYEILRVHCRGMEEEQADLEARRLNVQAMIAGRESEWAVVYPPGGLSDRFQLCVVSADD